MKKLNILKTLLDLFFFFGILSFGAVCIFVMIALFGEEPMNLKVNGKDLMVDNWGARSLLVFWLIAAALFVKAIQLLRRNVKSFVKREIFTDEVVRNFSYIGWCLLISTFVYGVPSFIYRAIVHEKVGLDLEIGSFDSGILSVALALFFMVLSEVFKIAKNLKEENDLTL
ncbi:DUF2975 domain-containing protein [Flavobacterium selenitireducens]|uniref:DUF2975 domain-containing protein n=1 Tax=Flavobacterium selenitireducens TaxID=2722704 RepID=UPI00168AC2F2|nr:DUF2975 domain-containing protein [Flavobacterium selenitireducens]MBD3581778.1 DUF2975 domain-containing protein [Flavobacterium selenitireducens]